MILSENSETEIEPGKQKNFYRHVSGAGDGLPLQTTADFGPSSTSNLIAKMDNEQPEIGNDDNAPNEQLPALAAPTQNNADFDTEQVNNENNEQTNEKRLEPDWQKKIRSLQDQVRTY